MPHPFRRPRALLISLLLAARAATAQAVLGPTEDATVAPVGVIRFRIANSWEHYDSYISGGDTTASAYVQVRHTPISTEIGLLPHLSGVLVIPSNGSVAEAAWSSLHGAIMLVDSVSKTAHHGLGDIELGGKFSWLPGPTERERIALSPGAHFRSSIAAFYRFPTGDADNPTDPFDVATGAQRPALGAASETDLMIGRGFWMSVVGHYTWQGTATVPVQVRPPGLPLSATYPTIDATQSAGNYWSIEATPRVVLGRYFSLGAQYAYVHRHASSFVGTLDTVIAGNPVTIDASTLDSASAGTAQYWSASFTYSTIAGYMQGKTGLPIEISFTHTGTLSATGSLAANLVTNAVTIRFWARLWGSARKKTPPSR